MRHFSFYDLKIIFIKIGYFSELMLLMGQQNDGFNGTMLLMFKSNGGKNSPDLCPLLPSVLFQESLLLTP